MFLLTLLLAAGCQDYNFNPVGHCLIQPGSERVQLSNVSSADVLFVVDDSGSMSAEQAALASNFDAFIGNLDAANAARRTAELEPFDFHIAVTSTSVFWNYQTNARPLGPYTCSASCGAASGQLVCCKSNNEPAIMPRACTSNAQCTAGTTCGTHCISPFAGEAALTGENYCCVQNATTSATAYPTGYVGDTIPCSRAGTECGTFERHYSFIGCGATGTNGVAWDGWPYPQGDFVSWTSATAVNPRVLHFDKELYPETPNPAATNKQGFTAQQLMDFFSGGGTVEGNVKVGICGSGEEQALAAARLAIEKARDGGQKDTYPRTKPASGVIQPTWDSANRVASSPADWFVPGANSKLVVVFVGDEDDCSPTAADPSGGVVWDIDDIDPGIDSCGLDASRAAPDGGKLHPVDSFVSFFTGLGRPVAAGFILPAAQDTCTLQSCTTEARCCPTGGCTLTEGAQGRGIRLLDTARALEASGVEVVAGSICDGAFGTILNDIAEIVKPPSSLTLPSQPAATEVTLLRIEAGGQTRKVCSRPAPAGLTLEAAMTARDANGNLYDWWFAADARPGGSVETSQYVYINPAGRCIANPGETYSADYLGRLPAGGCWDDTAYTPIGDETRGDAMCRGILGGEAGAWTCYAGVDGANACVTPIAASPGTCICGSRANNCGP
jgi:hypothetical protein